MDLEVRRSFARDSINQLHHTNKLTEPLSLTHSVYGVWIFLTREKNEHGPAEEETADAQLPEPCPAPADILEGISPVLSIQQL